jgi:hypothetical protein
MAAPRPAASMIEVPLPRPVPASRDPRRWTAGRVMAGELRACIVLTGGVVPSPLVQATGHCVLDLSITMTETVLERWVRQFGALAESEGRHLPIRIVHDARAPVPWPRDTGSGPRVELEPRPWRGPAGVLRDVCASYGAEDEILVVEAARSAAVELEPLLAAHRVRGAEVTVACHSDGTPAGMYVIRCGALAEVAPAGYVDLKEQWLRDLSARGRHIAVHVLPAPGAPPLRTPRQFLDAARQSAGGEAATADGSWRIVCPGAIIGPRAIITESIVMPGARIGEGALVARSIVCPGTHVQAGADIADAVVGTSRGLSDRRRDSVRFTRKGYSFGTGSQASLAVEQAA